MKIVKASYEILTELNGLEILKKIERAGRTCYKSEDRITDDSCLKFVKSILDSKHESVIEHESISIRFICDRGVSHELVRHRLSSFSQESTRYINYTKENKGGECTFIDIHPFIDVTTNGYDDWVLALKNSELSYKELINNGYSPQIARSVLPNSLKTEIVITSNIRQWRTILKQRTAKAAHPQMRELMCPLLDELKIKLPVLFDDITY